MLNVIFGKCYQMLKYNLPFYHLNLSKTGDWYLFGQNQSMSKPWYIFSEHSFTSLEIWSLYCKSEIFSGGSKLVLGADLPGDHFFILSYPWMLEYDDDNSIYLCHPGICDCCYKGRSWFRGLVGLVGLVGPVGLVVRMKKRMLMNLLAKLKTISSIKFQERYQPWTFFKIKEQQWYHPKNHYTNLHFLLIRKTNNHCHLLF